MAYQPAGAVACVPGFTFHRWSAVTAWGMPGARVVESQACVRCGCRRSRVVNLARPTMGQGWTYAEGRKGGDRG